VGCITQMLAARAARSMCGGGGARESGLSLVAGAVCVVIVVFDIVCIIIVVMSSLLRCRGWFERFIARMLAARAARSMRGGGGVREIVVFWVVGAKGEVGDNQSVIIVSWSNGCQPLGAAMVFSFSMLFLVPWCCRGRKKEVSGCLLSSSSH